MKLIDIRNKDLLEILEEAQWFVENHEKVEKYVKPGGVGVDASKHVSEEFKWKVINEGTAHEGFPECASGYNIKPEQIKYNNYNDEIPNRYESVNTQLMSFFGSRWNALFHVYNPGAFLSWHNNANASSYNLIFTYNPGGYGYFKMHDWKTGKTIEMRDPKGWSCKYGFFGSYKEPRDRLVYHCAYTEVWRMTISYIYSPYDTEIGKEFQKQVIEEISIE